MKREHINEIKAIIILSFGMILFASLISFLPEDLPWYTSSPNIPTKNLIRITGAYLSGALLFTFGYSSYALVLILLFWSWNKFADREINFSLTKLLSSFVLFSVLSSLFSMVGPQESALRFKRAGVVGYLISNFLVRYIGRMGAGIILITLGALAIILIGEFLVVPILFVFIEKMKELFFSAKELIEEKKADFLQLNQEIGLPKFSLPKKSKREESEEDEDSDLESLEEEPSLVKFKKPRIKIAPVETNEDEAEEEEESEEEGEEIVGEYRIPPLDLLKDPPAVSTSKVESDLMSGAKILEETLSQFNVNAKVVDIERGPAITRYELEPAPGVKIQKITSLSDDIALAMKVALVRIVAPIPGKNRIGIEVPNGASSVVYLKDVISSNAFRSSKSELTLSLGKDIAGAAIVADLMSMPHLLIAGTTGAGKTVCVNGIIMSIILNASPEDVKFVMVDPKMVELAQYNDIPHLLCPTVTDSKKAAAVLNWVVGEMESRYKQLSKVKVRNIKGYNALGNNMPYIVVIIDELADLMQVSAKTVESSITRIAQLSRAVGIHLILATQRPSVDVITGVIKANFPARISFKVASKVDSRTVLDFNGAETLLGRGDMLFIKPGDAKPTRGQCSYVEDEEINRVIDFIKDQQEPSYNNGIMKQQESGFSSGDSPKDDHYDEAVKLVIETNQASVSILQRRMRLGYTRAARLIDMMEQQGIVGPYCGSKPREIIVDREQWLLDNMQSEDS